MYHNDAQLDSFHLDLDRHISDFMHKVGTTMFYVVKSPTEKDCTVAFV